MSNEEIKEVQNSAETDYKCPFCKVVKKLLLIAVGTFIGFYCALCLFFTLHRPPMTPDCPKFRHHAGFEQKINKKFDKKLDKKTNFDVENQKPSPERPMPPVEK